MAVSGLGLADLRSTAFRLQLHPDLYGVADAVARTSIINSTIMTACLLSSSLTMVMGVFAAQRKDRTWTRYWLLATMAFGTAFIVLHGMEWSKLISEGLTLPMFPKPAHAAVGESRPRFRRTFRNLRRHFSG